MPKQRMVRVVVAFFACLSLLLLSACNGGGGKASSDKQSAPTKDAVARKDWPKGVTWSGSALGGAHYMFGSALAQVVSKHMNVPMTVEATGGPWQNVDLVNKGNTDFVPVPGATAYEAYTGAGQAKGTKYENMRAVMPMFPQYLQWWAFPHKGLKDFRDLQGKKVDMSGPGSFLNDYGRKLFDFFQVKPSQITNLSNFDDANQMLVDGQLDAVGAWSGIPAPPAQEMATTRNAVIFGVPKEDAEKFCQQYRVNPGVIPAGTYKGQDKDIETLVLWTFVITRKDLTEDFVYNLTKTAFENQFELVGIYKAAKDTKPENAKYSPIPLHPGAYKYYKEKGIELPKDAIPPELQK